MKPRRIVEVEVGINSCLQVLHCFVAFKIDVLVLEASPKTLNSDVVQSPVFSVHADLDVVINKNFDKNIRCKLASLIRVEDCRTAVFFVSVNSSLNYSTHSPRILKGVISMFQGSSLFQSSVL